MAQERKMAGKIQLNKRQKDILFYLSLVMISVYVFLLAGEKGYILFDDSHTYIERWYTEGVMPVYPLFVRVNKIIFGEAGFLYAIVIEQALIATLSVISFTKMIKQYFSLRYLEAYLVYIATLLPFTLELPTAMITHMILTEGIAFALFYLFVEIMLKAVWERNIKWLAGGWFMALFLSLIRSQLLLLFGVWGVVLIYIGMIRWSHGRRKGIKIVGILMGCVLMGLLGITANTRINSSYQQTVNRLRDAHDKTREQETVVEEENLRDNKNSGQMSAVSVSQYASLLYSRGMYEADYEDYQLFAEEEMQQLFLAMYEAADEAECRYVYAEKGLWMWRDIAGGIGAVGNEGAAAQRAYYEEKRPEVLTDNNAYRALSNKNYAVIGSTLLKKHMGRFLYHTIMLLPQGFICTVFFQVEKVYLLCHLITLFLYLSALALMIWGFADRKIERKAAELMAFVLGTDCVMVVLISMVFFGQQRYLFYAFGLFYVAYFVLLLQIWKQYGKRVVQRFRKRSKGNEDCDV